MPQGVICDVCGTAAAMEVMDVPCKGHDGLPPGLAELFGAAGMTSRGDGAPHMHQQERPPGTWFLLRSAADPEDHTTIVCSAMCVVKAANAVVERFQVGVQVTDEDLDRLLKGE